MGFEFYRDNSFLIPLLPLIGAIISGFFGARWLKGRSHWPIWVGVGISAFLSLGLLVATLNDVHHTTHATVGEASHWFTWIESGNFKAAAGAWLDPLTAVMLAVVCGIGLLICIFAAGYMKGEEGYFRFFAYLGLFIFSMTCLVMGNNLMMLYLGWEGVGLCSFLLVGYYYERPSAREAAKKAFLVNRVGDLGFAIGIILCYYAFGSVTYFTYHDARGVPFTGLLDTVHHLYTTGQLTHTQQLALDWIPFCLMLGAFGKSAQFPLYVWLPDAMEGPTPVSALIHAATMVTAGIYMIARCGVLFAGNGAALMTVAFVGAFTAIFAAVIALRQFDLKKVFAYSTISQLGFMVAAVGVLAPVAGVFHLVTHAFFKALLFLSSGVVMHAMLGELDMRKMSGLKRVLPRTRILMLVGCCALAGIPFFSGFFSKDEILGAAFAHSKWLGGILLVTAFLTAYYTFRLYFRVFEGPEVIPAAPDDHPAGIHRDEAVDPHLAAGAHQAATGAGASATPAHADHGHAHHNHEPAIMILPLVVLAVGAVLAGYLNFPKASLGEFLGHSRSFVQTFEVAQIHARNLAGVETGAQRTVQHVDPEPLGQHTPEAHGANVPEGHTSHTLLMVISGLVALAGVGLAYQFHLKNRPAGNRLPQRFPALARALENKFWVDPVYQLAIVEPLRAAGRTFYAVDRIVVDGLVWAVGFVPQFSGFALKLTTQRGYLQGYAGAMAFGIVIILLVVLW
jgi:NADH-quinone oxidoreductase subunit L